VVGLNHKQAILTGICYEEEDPLPYLLVTQRAKYISRSRLDPLIKKLKATIECKTQW
jgi:hypothetical protein